MSKGAGRYTTPGAGTPPRRGQVGLGTVLQEYAQELTDVVAVAVEEE